MVGVAASAAHERGFPTMARVDRTRRKLHSHAMVISSNAQTTNNNNGYIRPLAGIVSKRHVFERSKRQDMRMS